MPGQIFDHSMWKIYLSPPIAGQSTPAESYNCSPSPRPQEFFGIWRTLRIGSGKVGAQVTWLLESWYNVGLDLFTVEDLLKEKTPHLIVQVVDESGSLERDENLFMILNTARHGSHCHEKIKAGVYILQDLHSLGGLVLQGIGLITDDNLEFMPKKILCLYFLRSVTFVRSFESGFLGLGLNRGVLAWCVTGVI